MRLTAVLCKESYRWKFRMLWKNKAKFYDRPPILPSFIKEQGIDVQTASEITKPQLKFPIWEPPVEGNPLFEPARTMKDLPDYHDEPVYEYVPLLRLTEAEKQACLLTKSQPFYDLPESVTDLNNVPELPDQDMLVQRIIMQANVWDPSKEKLPKRFNKMIPGWKFKAEYGIPHQRTTSIMIRNLVRLCEMLGGRYPNLANSRQVVTEPYLSMFYFLKDNYHIVVRGKHNLMVYSDQPLKPFAGEELIDASTQYQLPEIYPLLPTIDLHKQHVWRSENITGLKEGSSHPYPHTLFMDYGTWWSVPQRNASMLMFSFGYALALAKQKYGWDAKELPEPVPIQCVMTDGAKFLFSCFQLNTLNYSNNDGVKNFVWFSSDGDRSLYNKIVPKRAMLRNTRYEDYDPDVFRQIVAFYTNGASLSDSSVRDSGVAATLQSQA